MSRIIGHGFCWFVFLASTALAGDRLTPEIEQIIRDPRFKNAHWGVLVVDLKTGDVVYEHNADQLFAPASTTKLYSVAAALDRLGKDFRFETPIYRRGELVDGQLQGDLILVASGDLTLGGRTTANGEIAFANHDHTYANGTAEAELTAPDPLAGLDDLARQVASAGIKRHLGEVVIDDRLFDSASSTGSGPSQLGPILVNDNVIDLHIAPGKQGEPAVVEHRPQASILKVENKVRTAKPKSATLIGVDASTPWTITIEGQIAADHKPVLHVYEIPDAASWARTLLIEALKRAGVETNAKLDTPNPSEILPEKMDYAGFEQTALLRSPPFSENARLILKVSHNLHASTLPLLLAAREGKRSLAAGLRMQHDFLKNAGVAVDEISFGGAAGGANADFTTPRVNVQLLRSMSTRPDFDVYERALPVLGVDGTLSDAVAADSPARGKAQAKTGTLYWRNTMNQRYLLTSKALAGYLTAASGRRLAFSLVVNGVHIKGATDRTEIGQTLGHLCEIIHQAN
jgi:D-alanyl-D-alanine carboxypeptidase/D-alanyl-D-alanine-endopeptidase (penicillin-binding protein 4)